MCISLALYVYSIILSMHKWIIHTIMEASCTYAQNILVTYNNINCHVMLLTFERSASSVNYIPPLSDQAHYIQCNNTFGHSAAVKFIFVVAVVIIVIDKN